MKWAEGTQGFFWGIFKQRVSLSFNLSGLRQGTHGLGQAFGQAHEQGMFTEERKKEGRKKAETSRGDFRGMESGKISRKN